MLKAFSDAEVLILRRPHAPALEEGAAIEIIDLD